MQSPVTQCIRGLESVCRVTANLPETDRCVGIRHVQRHAFWVTGSCIYKALESAPTPSLLDEIGVYVTLLERGGWWWLKHEDLVSDSCGQRILQLVPPGTLGGTEASSIFTRLEAVVREAVPIKEEVKENLPEEEDEGEDEELKTDLPAAEEEETLPAPAVLAAVCSPQKTFVTCPPSGPRKELGWFESLLHAWWK